MVQPPRIFQEAGVLQNPKELWLVKKALHGLVTSPRDWCDHRDGKIKNFQWLREGRPVRVRATPQADIWLVQEQDDRSLDDQGGVGHVRGRRADGSRCTGRLESRSG